MATIIGNLRPDATKGEQAVFGLLNRLPNSYLVWPELNIHDKYPDFVVVHPRLGVAVLEVKDWVEIVEANAETFIVRTRQGDERAETNPLRSVRDKTLAIARRLEAKPALLHATGPHQGKGKVPWAYALIFPNLTRMTLFQLGDLIEPQQLIGHDDLQYENLEPYLDRLPWRFRVALSDLEIDEVRAALYPELTITHSKTGTPLGIVDTLQERAAKEGLFEVAATTETTPGPHSTAHLESELTPEGRRVARDPIVRLIRGVAGSGKTLVLALRARYLTQMHPDWRILVVTYNRSLTQDLRRRLADLNSNVSVANFHQLCHQWLETCDLWHSSPAGDMRGRITHILQRNPELSDKFEPGFLLEEITWMKETGAVTREEYMNVTRTGRGVALQRDDRERVYAIYTAYEENLRAYRQMDWADVPLLTLRAIHDGLLPNDSFDAILIDEAQDFAPTWFQVLRNILNPQTRVIFMAADSTQRIYRKFTWRALGFNVVGRSRILPRSYRSTYQIMRTAFELLRDNEDLHRELQEDDEELLNAELDPKWMRHGDYPVLKQFANVVEEYDFMLAEIRRLLDEGCAPGEIAILHRKKWGVDRYRGKLKNEGLPVESLQDATGTRIVVDTMHATKGLEFRVVFVCGLQDLFNPDTPLPSAQQTTFITSELRLLYVAITRARGQVYLHHQKTLPRPLHPLATFLTQAPTTHVA